MACEKSASLETFGLKVTINSRQIVSDVVLFRYEGSIDFEDPK